LFVAGLLAAAGLAADEPAPRAVPADLATATAVFDSIEAAWLRGDAAGLVARFAPGRVLLRLPGNASDGDARYSHQQCLLILRTHFDSHVVRRFEFHETQASEVAPGRAVGLAAVSWRILGVGRTKEGRMLVVLDRTPDGWAVSQMQALP
jgi:hypothetical protein